MSVTRRHLIREYVGAIRNGDAALFIGAGLSRESGYVDWKGLMRGCAEELGLDLDREFDLVAVAQYYLNLHRNNRFQLNQKLIEEFSRRGEFTENHKIIGRLPITSIWTTNFDKLIEQALDNAGRRVDVKSTDTDIANPVKGRDVVLYKMHGDIARPSEVVICKADYERYAREHPVFQTTLEAELVAKTFLFLGFSFADPNLNYMLGHLNTLLPENQHQHFAIMRRVREDHSLGDEGRRIYEYERNKQELQIGELKRYNIQTHLIDRFGEVADILREIEESACRKTIFISGSANKFESSFDEERTRDFCVQLGEVLIQQNFKVINGFGLNIGDSVVKGAVLAMYQRRDLRFEDRITLRPFPRNLPAHVSEPHFLNTYRRQMISQCGFAIFVSGTSRSKVISDGVMDEYRISRNLGKIPIPIAVSGFAARRIWEEMRDERDQIYHGRVDSSLYDRLADSSQSNTQLIQTILDIMECVSAL